MDAKTLALYLGCETNLGTLITVKLDEVVTSSKLGGYINVMDFTQIKLLLRPLSSMTEEETIEFKKLISVDHIGFSDFKGHQTWQYWEHEEISNYESKRVCKTTSEIGALPLRCVQYLLSKGFDLFSLIEKGEAIDNTALTPTP